MNNIIKKHNINFFFSKYLTDLENYKISVICDDSGSMCNPVKKIKLNVNKKILIYLVIKFF
jgi:hypothetical protein